MYGELLILGKSVIRHTQESPAIQGENAAMSLLASEAVPSIPDARQRQFAEVLGHDGAEVIDASGLTEYSSVTLHWTLEPFELIYAALILIVLIVFTGPLMVFVPKLFRLKQDGLSRYDTLASRYKQEFDSKWARGANPTEESLLRPIFSRWQISGIATNLYARCASFRSSCTTSFVSCSPA